MPQDTPSYSKLIYISYGEEKDFGCWLYQRLKYSQLPVRTHGVDEAIGGGGFTENSVAAAHPLILVMYESRKSTYELDIARRKGREIVYVPLDESSKQWSENQGDGVVLDFSLTQWKRYDEEKFLSLREHLGTREYPAPFRELPDPAGDENLEYARGQLRKYGGNYAEFHYIRVFGDLYNRRAKIAALRDLGSLKKLSGLVIAVLQGDPQEEVRAEAALSLSKFQDYSLHHYLNGPFYKVYDGLLPIYASIALLYTRNPQSISKLIDDVNSAYVNPAIVEVGLPTTYPVGAEQTEINSDLHHEIFVSYARKDSAEYAVRLTESLSQSGFTVWIDTLLEPGTEEWTIAIEQAIDSCQIMIALMSPAANASEWVRKEIHFAKESKKEIIPIYTLQCKKPLALQGMQGLRGDPVLSEEPEVVTSLLIDHLRNRFAAG